MKRTLERLCSGSRALRPVRGLLDARQPASLLGRVLAHRSKSSSIVLFRLIASAECAPDRCLDAFIVALHEARDGNSWYTSTKELQLASLQFYSACRSVATLALRVDCHMPCRLLASTDAPPPNRKRLCSTRVRRLRARRVRWKLSTAAEMRTPLYALADAEEIRFGIDFGVVCARSHGRIG